MKKGRLIIIVLLIINIVILLSKHTKTHGQEENTSLNKSVDSFVQEEISSKNVHNTAITKPDIKEEIPNLSEKVYSFLEYERNQRDVYNAAIKLNQGRSENTCVYFISEVLRRNNFKVPKETKKTSEIISLLEKSGFTKQSDYKNLMPGDICFTTNEKSNKNGFPTHTYIFMKWVKEGNYDYAYICDNQAKDYNDKIYHIRNIKVLAKANGFDKDAFAFFMKKT